MREATFDGAAAERSKRVGIVGGGVAGIVAALEARHRGHEVTLFEAGSRIGGQFLLAAKVPGKEDYALSITSFEQQLADAGVDVHTDCRATFEMLVPDKFDDVVVATGVTARKLDVPGSDDVRVVDYASMLTGKVRVGERVVIIGGGGIGHDVALFLARGEDTPPETIAGFKQHWGIGQVRTPRAPARSITMVKRSPGPFGKSLGKSTGWILRQELKDFGVRQIDDATYLSIEAGGLRISTGGTEELLPADTIVVCAGQLSLRELADQLIHANQNVHVIGGAANAGELDAKRAISEGALIGASL